MSMNRYICMLRGINVGGQKRIKMAELKNVYEALGFEGVLTYIQSGNVIFECPDPDTDVLMLAHRIEVGIKQMLDLDVKVLVKTHLEFSYVVGHNPFDDDGSFVTFLFSVPMSVPLDELNKVKQPSERFTIVRDFVYFYCPDGYGRTKLSNNFFEAKLNVFATTRGWRTVKRLYELAG